MELFNPSGFLIFWSVLSLAGIILWIIALVDILRSEFSGHNDKLIWVIVVILAPFLGAILYYIIGRRNKINYK